MLRRHFNMVSEGGANYDYAIIYHAPEHNFFLNYPDLQGYWGHQTFNIPETPFTLIEDSYNESAGIGIWKFKGATPYVIGPVRWYDGDNSDENNLISVGGITYQYMASPNGVVGNSFCNITDVIITNNISIYPSICIFVPCPALSYIDPEAASGDLGLIPHSINTITMTGTIYSLGAIGYLSDIVIPRTVELIDKLLYNAAFLHPSKTITVEEGNRFYDSRENCNALIETSTNKLILASDATTHIPSSITCIGEGAFYSHPRDSIVVPDTVLTMGGGVFTNAKSSNIIIPDHIKVLDNSSFDGLTQGFFEGCTNLKAINLPSQLEVIGLHAFRMCRSLTSITIPKTVTSIGDRAFDDCLSLTSIVWNAKNCLEVGSFYVYGISRQITSFTFGNEVECIPASLCLGMEKLTSITIPASVTSIGEGAFNGCSSLTSITFEGTIEQWNAVTKGSDWNNNVPATVVHCTDGDVAL